MSDDESKESVISMTSYVVKQCRKFGLLYNERTTILSQADESQLIQYCLACHKQQESKNFDASPTETIEMVHKVHHFQLVKLEQLIQNCIKDCKIQQPHRNHKVKGESLVAPDEAEYNESASVETYVLQEDFHQGRKKHEIDGGEDVELDSVLALFTSLKETSNHQSTLDCYTKFVQELSKLDSKLHSSLVSSEDRLKLTMCDERSLSSIQSRLCEVLMHLNPNLDTAKLIPVQAVDATIEQPKTPSRVRFAKVETPQQHSPLMVSTPITPATPAQKRKIQKAFVLDIFRSYIHLLVNCRSQLALARVFNVPSRGLDHFAFTHLKHEASSSNLSMYQSLASFVMRVRLGGQGYAPSSNSPLLAHIKGLGILLDFTQKLQTVVEEVADLRSACRRVVNIVKNSLVQCKSGRFLHSLVEPCAAEVQASLSTIIDAETAKAGDSPQREAGAGGSVLGRRCLQILQIYLDQTALRMSSETDHKMLQDLSFLSHSQTPSRIPCLLSQFRSPCMIEPSEDDTHERRLKESSKPRKLSSRFVSSALFIEEDGPADITLTQRTLSSVEVLPSVTVAHPKAGDGKCGSTENGVESTDCKILNSLTFQSNINTNTNKSEITDKQKQGKCAGKKRGIIVDQENMESNVVCSQGTRVVAKKKRESKLSAGSMKGVKGVGEEVSGKTRKAGKSCRKQLLPQVKGQAKITGFFRI